MVASNSPAGFTAQQAQRIPLFALPPLDKSLPFAEFVDWHMGHSPEHTLVQLVRPDNQKPTNITMLQFGNAVHSLGRELLEILKQEPRAPTVVGIKMSTHLLLYTTVICALLRAGFQPLSIAMSMPEYATRHLLEQSKAQYLICIDDAGRPIAQVVNSIGVPEDARALPSMSLAALYPSITSDGDTAAVSALPRLRELCPWMRSYAYDDLPTIVGHTSGSTGLPKAIPFRQKALLSWLICPWFGEIDLGGQVLPVGFLPPHHITAMAALVIFPMASGMILAMDHPSSPQTPTTPSGILDFCKRAKVDTVVFPPMLYEFWSRDPAAVKYLASIPIAMIGMGGLDLKVGDKLVEGGVRLLPGYGSTEGSEIWAFRSVAADKDWSYGKILPYIPHRLIPVGLNRYRLEVMESDIYSPAVFNAEEGTVYNTHDIIERHPRHLDLYRVVERDDNQVKLATGELVPVAQIEAAVRQCPEVKQATAFGQGRYQVGILVESREDQHRSGDGLVAFLKELRPYIVTANDSVPTYARVPTDLVVVIPPGTSLPLSAKGAVSRQVSVKIFASQIDDAYNSLAISRSRFRVPEVWTEETVHAFVADVVSTVVCPCTSCRDYRTSSVLYPVYLYPTVRALATFVFSGETKNSTSEGSEDVASSMSQLVDVYTTGLPSRSSTLNTACTKAHSGQTVLMTGSTGALGTFVLAELLRDPLVDTVYAVVRQADGLQQQVAAFIDRGLNPDDLAISKLKVIRGDASEPRFGIDESNWLELIASCTAIVHCAWRLDFNLGLESFKAHIAGVRTMVDIALASTRPVPPHLVFMSSIDTVHSWKEPYLVPNSLLDVRHVLGSGYGESKWVAERILEKAAETSGLRVTSLRLSQLSGATTNGAWNTTDWVPQIVRAGVKIGALPVYQPGMASWLPLDVAAKASVAAMRSPGGGFRVLNVGNPNPTPWETLLQELATVTSQHINRPIALIKSTEWAAKIKQPEMRGESMIMMSPEENPMLHIAQFLTGWRGERWYRDEEDSNSPFNDALGIPRLDTSAICEIFPELYRCAKVGRDDVVKWVDYWGKHGLFAAVA
ncbi:acetyl-CoA synthetase-like protein [Exidia glandulosa HHB12029]|uniref:Acetyl-CoA synthetase-like protein n=1 Tax=Exidia glandulosa HHB12029 TaxID=1314781 RepID=A0A165NSE2_EXIGL|nr:acetyl-CoA synthetase-like protein [Exidia glandulosa HHB12029]